MDKFESANSSCEGKGSLRTYDSSELKVIALHDQVTALLPKGFDIRHDEERVCEWELSSTILVDGDYVELDGELILIESENLAITTMHLCIEAPDISQIDLSLPYGLKALALVKNRDITAEDVTEFLETSWLQLEDYCNGFAADISDLEERQEDGSVWRFTVKRHAGGFTDGIAPRQVAVSSKEEEDQETIVIDARDTMEDWGRWDLGVTEDRFEDVTEKVEILAARRTLPKLDCTHPHAKHAPEPNLHKQAK